MHVVIADDEVLLRQGFSRLLETTDIGVLAERSRRRPRPQDAVAEYEPDVAIVDSRCRPRTPMKASPLRLTSGPLTPALLFWSCPTTSTPGMHFACLSTMRGPWATC